MLVKEATAREYTSVNSCSKDKYLLPNKGHLKRSSVQYQPFLSESECVKCEKRNFANSHARNWLLFAVMSSLLLVTQMRARHWLVSCVVYGPVTVVTSNGSWRQGIKGEMTCTVYVALVWNIIYWIIMMTMKIIIIIIIIIIMMMMMMMMILFTE